MDCVKLYFKNDLIGILTYDDKKDAYLFVKNKFLNNAYIENVMGLKEGKEVYYSPNLFSFFFAFINKYSDKKYDNEYDELVKIAKMDFDKNQFWIGA